MSTSSFAFRRDGWPAHITWRHLSDFLAMLATVAAVLSLYAVSPVLLEHFGVSYIMSGGGAISKFHPGTFLAVAALVLRCGASSRPFHAAWRLVTTDPGVVILLTAVGVTDAFAALVAKTPVTPVVDTFVLPVLVFILLHDLDAVVAKRLALIVACLLAANAVMALIEFARGVHFVTVDVQDATSDPTRGDAVFNWRAQLAEDWRAVALLGHPLVNGLIVGCFIICLAARGANWLPSVLKLPLALSQLASMFAFGARASLVLSLAFAGYLLLERSVVALREQRRLQPRALAVALIAVALAIVAVGVLNETGFFDRTVERFANDSGSAGTRLTMFELFTPFDWSELLLGPDKDVVATGQAMHGLEFGIESSWVGLALNYGLIVTAIIMIGLLAFSRSVVRACGRGAAGLLLFYFISVSATASLSGKTTTLAMTVAMALLFLRKDERSQPLSALIASRRG